MPPTKTHPFERTEKIMAENSSNTPIDAAAAADAAFAAVAGKPFPSDVFTAPELRWAVIGCGVIANQMAESFALAGRKLAGVQNRTRAKAEAFAERWGIARVYDTPEELYADPDIDAIYITTPHNTHIKYLRGALGSGKHVLCEKSITLNSEELAEALTIADANHVQLVDATTILHMPLYREIIRRAMAGDFGQMNLAQINFGSYKEFDPKSRFYNRDLAGGALLDIGVYAITLARLFMVSLPEDVLSIANACSTGVDVTSGIVLRNPDMQMATITLSLHSKQPKRAVLSFDDCYIEVTDYPRADRATIVWTADGRREEIRAGEEAYALCYEAANLERAVADDQVEQNMIAYTVDVMAIMTMLRRQWGIRYPEEEQA